MSALQMSLVFLSLLVTKSGLHAAPLNERVTLKAHSIVESLAFSPDGKTLATACPEVDTRTWDRWAELSLWDVPSGKLRVLLKGHKGGVESMAFSPDGRILATGSDDYTVKLWDVVTDTNPARLRERATLEGHQANIRRVAFSPDGKTLGSADDLHVKLWDVATARQLSSFSRLVLGRYPVFSPNLRILASANHQDVDLWDVSTGRERLSLLDHRGSVGRVAFSSDSGTLAVASCRQADNGKYFGELKLWDPQSGKERASFRVPPAYLRIVEISPDGKSLVLQSERELGGTPELQLLELPSGQSLGTINLKGRKSLPLCLAFSLDGKILAAGCEDGKVRLWDTIYSAQMK